MTSADCDSPERLEALARYDILDTPPEEVFDQITRLAAGICDAPIAMINFIDRDRQWFKSEIGLGLKQTSLDVSFCAQALLQPGIFTVSDTFMDPRFSSNPLVTGWPHLRFYGGILLESSDGFGLGTLCVMDYKPRGLTDAQKEALLVFGNYVMTLLESRRNAKLLEQSAMAKGSADKGKNEFLAMLSQELRSPLAPVLMATYSLLLDPGLSSTQRAELETIRANVELETKLIEDLLDLSQMAQSKLELRRQPVDVHDLMERAEQITRAGGAPIRIEKVFRASVASVLGDAVRLEQVFWTLLNDAIRSMPAAGCIAVITNNPRPDLIRIRIVDTSNAAELETPAPAAAPSEHERRDFMPRLAGLGLGFPVTQEIVALHNGSIKTSNSGKSKRTAFTIELPTAAGADAGPAPVSERIAPSGQSLRILLVEADESNAQTLARLLRREGHDVETASSAARAKLLFHQRDFDLLISGVDLPDGSGLDLMRHVRTQRPIDGIALTGYGTPEAVEATSAAGFREHLVKPVEWPKLDAAVRRTMPRLQLA